jgi:hypothetical protein
MCTYSVHKQWSTIYGGFAINQLDDCLKGYSHEIENVVEDLYYVRCFLYML